MNRSILSQLFVAIFFSTMLVSCSGGGSSNSKNQSNSNLSIGNSSEGATLTNANGIEIKVNPDGVLNTINDPQGTPTTTPNPNGGSTITASDGSEVVISPDGFVNSISSGGTTFRREGSIFLPEGFSIPE